MNYMKQSWRTLLKSFSFRQKFFLAFLADGLLFALVFLIFFFFVKSFTLLLSKLNSPNLELLEQVLFAIKVFVIKFIALALISLIVFYILYSIMKGAVWRFVAGKKITKKFIKRFALLNLPWFAVWVFVFLILRAVVKKSLFTFVFTIIALFLAHLTLVLYSEFDGKVKHAFRKMWKLGVKKIHYFILPYMIFTILLTLFSFFSLIFHSISLVAFFVAQTIIMLFFVNWLRFYVKLIIKEIEKK